MQPQASEGNDYSLTNKLTHESYKPHKETDHHERESAKPQPGRLASGENRTEQRPRGRDAGLGKSMDDTLFSASGATRLAWHLPH